MNKRNMYYIPGNISVIVCAVCLIRKVEEYTRQTDIKSDTEKIFTTHDVPCSDYCKGRDDSGYKNGYGIDIDLIEFDRKK